MDIVDNCNEIIETNIKKLGGYIKCQRVATGCDEEELTQTQSIINAAFIDRDRNLDKILDQQAGIKTIIERDNLIRATRKSIAQDSRAIDALRKEVAKIGMDAMKCRSELLETQAKDVERFQMHQLRSIAEDYKRHQDILEFRKKEICDMKKEIEKEDEGRDAYLADFEKNLEKQLQARQQMRGQSDSIFPSIGLSDEIRDPDHLELTSVNEYQPYGSAPGAKATASSGKKQTAIRGRGRRRGGANSSSN